jgi:Transposase.
VLKRSSKSKSGQYPLAFKLKAIKRVERGEGVLPVARELGVTRKALHDWIRAYKAHGPEGLNRKRGPKPGRRRLKPVPAGAAVAVHSSNPSTARCGIARTVTESASIALQRLDRVCDVPKRLGASSAYRALSSCYPD